MNGWKRIGIIVSVIWVFGAGLHAYDSEIDRDSRLITLMHVQCDSGLSVYKDLSEQDAAFRRCNKHADDALSGSLNSARLVAALVAFVPVILGWPFVYLLVFLVRWVKRGFVQQPSRFS